MENRKIWDQVEKTKHAGSRHGKDRIENRIFGLKQYLPLMNTVERERAQKTIDHLARTMAGITERTRA